jgi:prephenate dehydrogenase
MDLPNNICIVGLGLLGGSYAMGLTRAGCTVSAVDLRAGAIRYALDNGLIAAGTAEDPAPLLEKADAVVLGLYPRALVEWLQKNQGLLKPGALVTDVCGVKGGIVEAVQGFLRPDVEFIASHPMAGREVSGVEYANCEMFRPANFIIVPTGKNTPRGIAFAQALAGALGFAHITQLSSAEHDKMIGYVSQLTHAIAVSLMNATDNTHLAEYTGDSFRDLTRIAKINEQLWSELFFANRENLIAEIDQFAASLEGLKQALANGDEAELKRLFVQSARRRSLFDQRQAER